MKTLAVAVLSLLIVAYSKAETKRVLFIGNSYIYTNNLPQVLKDVALSNGDDVILTTALPVDIRFSNILPMQLHCLK